MEKEMQRQCLQCQCKEAWQTIRSANLPLNELFQKAGEGFWLALDHYLYCRTKPDSPCGYEDFQSILGKEISCREAVEAAARCPHRLFVNNARTLIELLAFDHIDGRRNGAVEHGACPEPLCTELRRYWRYAPLDTARTAEEQMKMERAFCIGLFRRYGLSTLNLFPKSGE